MDVTGMGDMCETMPGMQDPCCGAGGMYGGMYGPSSGGGHGGAADDGHCDDEAFYTCVSLSIMAPSVGPMLEMMQGMMEMMNMSRRSLRRLQEDGMITPMSCPMLEGCVEAFRPCCQRPLFQMMT